MNFIRKINEMKLFMENARPKVSNHPQKERLELFLNKLEMNAQITRAWSDLGSKTFKLSKDLIDAFNYTDVSLDVTSNDFKYPFDCFLLDGDIPFYQILWESKPVNIECILYASANFLENHDWFIPYYIDGSRIDKLEWDHSIRAYFVSPDGMVNSYVLLIDNHNRISSIIDYQPINVKYPIEPAKLSDAQKLCNIFFNSLLYINDPTRNQSETQMSESRKVKISGKESVKHNYIYLRPPKLYKPLYSSSGKTLDVRFLVRGHWRNQACGKEMKHHRRMWIFPYWKGPEMSEIVSKPYIVK